LLAGAINGLPQRRSSESPGELSENSFFGALLRHSVTLEPIASRLLAVFFSRSMKDLAEASKVNQMRDFYPSLWLSIHKQTNKSKSFASDFLRKLRSDTDGKNAELMRLEARRSVFWRGLSEES
jgi:hypothetical protein